jgi:hypothetical protein
MKKQSLFNRAVKITAVSMLTFCLFFNIGIDLESGKNGIPAFKAITFGNVAVAQSEVDEPELDGGLKPAHGCKYTGNINDYCFYLVYIIYNCRDKSVIDETPTDCGYN